LPVVKRQSLGVLTDEILILVQQERDKEWLDKGREIWEENNLLDTASRIAKDLKL